MSLKTQLKKRKPEHQDLVFCMDRPLMGELEQARRDGAASAYAGNARVQELEKAVAAASVTIRISSLPREEYYAIMAEHPPRDGEDEIFNPETFFEACAKASALEVTAKSTVPIPDEDWDEFVSGLTDGEFDRLAGAVVQVNRSQATVNIAPLG